VSFFYVLSLHSSKCSNTVELLKSQKAAEKGAIKNSSQDMLYHLNGLPTAQSS